MWGAGEDLDVEVADAGDEGIDDGALGCRRCSAIIWARSEALAPTASPAR